MRLEGRIALVTGGAGGIGGATCRRLAAEGATVAVTDLNVDGAREVASEVGGGAYELDEDVLVAGDSGDAKRAVAELIARIPVLRPVNAGRLEAARLIEGITPLLISVNARYGTTAGVKLTGLPDELW